VQAFCGGTPASSTSSLLYTISENIPAYFARWLLFETPRSNVYRRLIHEWKFSSPSRQRAVGYSVDAAQGRPQAMDEMPPSLPPAVMEGHGRYNRNSQVQASSLSPALAMLERAVAMAAVPSEPQPIVIADYGSSQGHNSLAPLLAAIRVLRQRIGQDRDISVVHTDLPENDFTVLFQTLITSPESYLQNDAAVFPSAIGRSFYEQILPSGSVTVGWSSWAVQWLSSTPEMIPDQVHVAHSQDASARAAFSRQAAEDWRRFLVARGRELCPGGRLAILTMASDDQGEFGYGPLGHAMYATLVEMVEGGFLSAQELRCMAIPTVGRTRADLLAPFGADGHFSGLEVEEVEVFFGEDRIWSDFEQHRNAQEFGARWAAFSRASVFPTLARSLDVGRTNARAAEFIERTEAGMAARLAVEPEPMRMPLGRMLLAKKK
jgi:SAM dependent carboxyl methyltransferase